MQYYLSLDTPFLWRTLTDIVTESQKQYAERMKPDTRVYSV